MLANQEITESEKLMVVLRDGRKLIGVLRSWDQFGVLYHRDIL
jgi:U6 snRNA-associated Sm-like protein LSm1